MLLVSAQSLVLSIITCLKETVYCWLKKCLLEMQILWNNSQKHWLRISLFANQASTQSGSFHSKWTELLWDAQHCIMSRTSINEHSVAHSSLWNPQCFYLFKFQPLWFDHSNKAYCSIDFILLYCASLGATLCPGFATWIEPQYSSVLEESLFLTARDLGYSAMIHFPAGPKRKFSILD